MSQKIKRAVGPKKRVLITAASLILIGFAEAHSAARGAVSFSDQASNTAYANGMWTTGSNGGSGFAPWQLVPDVAQSGVNQSATWGFDTESAANVFGVTASPNIDSNGVAWTLWSQNATGTDPVAQTAYRKFNYALVPGATFSVDMTTDAIGTQGAEGFQLQNYDPSTNYATPILEVAAFASGSDYSVSWGGYTTSVPGFANSVSSTISSVHDGSAGGNNGNGLEVTVTIGNSNTASVTLTPLNTAVQGQTFSSLTINNLPINQLALFNDNLGSNYQADYFNNINITDPVSTPEPTSLGLMLGLMLIPGLGLMKKTARKLNYRQGGVG